MKLFLSLFVIILSIFQTAQAQVKAYDIFKINANRLGTDIHGTLYLTAKNHIYKYDPRTKERMNYSGRSSLNFSAFDLSDPFKVIVYDKSFREFLVFDKQLKFLSNTKLELPNEFIEDPLFVRNNQAFFLFNPETHEIYRYSLNFQFINKTFLEELHPFQITELHAAGSKLFFLSKNDRIFSFSSEGAFLGKFCVSDFKAEKISKPVFIQIDNENSQIKLIDPLNKSYKTVKLEEQTEKIKAAALYKESLYFISANTLKQADLD